VAEAFGSPANPVALDPFQNVVAVHWKRKLAYIAFQLRLEVVEVQTGGPDSAPSGPLLSPTTGYDSLWLLESRYRYFSGSVVFPGVPPSALKIYVDDEWIEPLSTITVDGLPDLEDGSAGHATYAPWQAASIQYGLTQSSFGRWIDPAGSVLEIPVPGLPEVFFIEGAPAASVYGPTFGTPAGYELEPDSGLYTYLAPYQASAIQSQFALAADVSITLEDGTEYVPFAAKAVPFVYGGVPVGRIMRGPGDTGGVGDTYLLWVLCRPSETTS
jgi:hypothetical protein